MKPVVLCVLDGWGYRADSKDNAIAMANLPHWNAMWAECPHALLETGGLSVGLPEGQMGNSEVGHLTIGAGRVVFQDLPKISRAIESGEMAQNPSLLKFIAAMRESKGTCHLMGLVSPGGVHAHQEHILALAKILDENGIPVAVHVFTDGRDVPPQSALEQVKAFVEALPAGVSIASLSGRYFAMDRDKRWERIETAYRAMAEGKSETRFTSVTDAIKASYDAGVNDEFIKPTVSQNYAGMQKGDGILFANFRSDRARQILTALLDFGFTAFSRRQIAFAAALGMVEYSRELNPLMTTLFPPKSLSETLGEVTARAGKKQLRLAETEKYAHVTFFLNGGEEKVYPGEERILVPSPKVATYDLKPEMSAAEVGSQAVNAIKSGRFDLIVINFANADMVGHTGILPAAIKAVEAIDTALGEIKSALNAAGGTLLITADHGNCEEMYDESTHGPHTAHSLNPVPVLVTKGAAKLRDGTLADVAPTVLQLMGIPQPASMTGKSLIAA